MLVVHKTRCLRVSGHRVIQGCMGLDGTIRDTGLIRLNTCTLIETDRPVHPR